MTTISEPDAPVLCEIADGVATVTLNRPDRMNAWTHGMEIAYFDLVDALDDDPAVRAVVLTGAGRGFCPGLDASDLADRTQGIAGREGVDRPMTYARGLRKPLIAAINGTCVGGGLELAMACDLRLAARSARFGLPENNLGLIPGIGGCSRLVKLVGFGRAKELVMTGEIISADDALHHGLVGRVVDDGALMTEARALAERLRAKAPQALGIAKRVLQNCVSADLGTARTIESFGQSILIKTKDHREGVTAFREKRRPKFEGR
jgi:enoyl-CoA hydratase